MCGRFDTSNLTWVEIYDALKTYSRVVSDTLTVDRNPDACPATPQITARLGDDGWLVEKMRWSLVPFWRNGKPLKDSAKGAGDGKLADYHTRAPVILEPDDFLQWLDPSQNAMTLLSTVRPDRFEIRAAA